MINGYIDDTQMNFIRGDIIDVIMINGYMDIQI